MDGAGDLHDSRLVEEALETIGFDGRRHEDDLQVRPARQELAQVPDEEIDVERALVDLIHDEDVVGPQLRITRDLLQQDAIGHHLEAGALRNLLVETGLETDDRAEAGTLLLGDARCHRAGGQAARLCETDARLGPFREAELGNPGGFAGARGATHDSDGLSRETSPDLAQQRRDG